MGFQNVALNTLSDWLESDFACFNSLKSPFINLEVPNFGTTLNDHRIWPIVYGLPIHCYA